MEFAKSLSLMDPNVFTLLDLLIYFSKKPKLAKVGHTFSRCSIYHRSRCFKKSSVKTFHCCLELVFDLNRNFFIFVTAIIIVITIVLVYFHEIKIFIITEASYEIYYYSVLPEKYYRQQRDVLPLYPLH